ncbi:MAG: N-acetyl sugar amidotransferase, partial [Leptospiraceae bacterium]|nr:N-acetyl sugar amidotransferase [Leptospiraceae bacterium]
MPSTRPEQVFDEEGVCDACRSVDRKNEIDWDQRRKELEAILDQYRSDGTHYDCIIPVSGGKDSCTQALTMRDEFGMHPLCVNHVPCELTEVGQKNLTFLRELGFDLIQVGVNRKAYREMVRVGFFELGDSCWPEHIGIFTVPVRLAVQYEIPLLIWGENSQFEYGGPASKRENHFLDRNWLEQFQMYGLRISDVVHFGIEPTEIKPLWYPDDDELKRVGVTGLFLGYYKKWDTWGNITRMLDLGWSPNPDGPVENAWNAYENLDCKWIGGLHDYMKFIKYGFARATDQLCIEIRHGRMSRNQAIDELLASTEGQVPWKYVPDFLNYLSITEQEF